jgi:hypothetical protein
VGDVQYFHDPIDECHAKPHQEHPGSINASIYQYSHQLSQCRSSLFLFINIIEQFPGESPGLFSQTNGRG